MKQKPSGIIWLFILPLEILLVFVNLNFSGLKNKRLLILISLNTAELKDPLRIWNISGKMPIPEVIVFEFPRWSIVDFHSFSAAISFIISITFYQSSSFCNHKQDLKGFLSPDKPLRHQSTMIQAYCYRGRMASV